jgi:predicted short-subunit dehydrogenase-like oxidoreductase (DUF2520 family)
VGIFYAVGGEERAREWALEIVERLRGKPLSIAEGRQAVYHAGAVMAGNTLTAIVDAAVRLMGEAGIDEQAALEAIAPLCRTSLDNTLRLGPEAALTGPAARGDAGTIRQHVAAVRQTPVDVRELYRSAGACLVDLARRRGMALDRLREMTKVLEGVPTGMPVGENDGI